MLLLSSCFLRVCYCTLGRLHFCRYMRGSSQLSSGSSQLSSARALLCVSTLKEKEIKHLNVMHSIGLSTTTAPTPVTFDPMPNQVGKGREHASRRQIDTMEQREPTPACLQPRRAQQTEQRAVETSLAQSFCPSPRGCCHLQSGHSETVKS